MKKALIYILAVCMAFLTAGCSPKEEQKEAAVPTAQIAYAAYRYEGGYQLSEGWLYDMTVSDAAQLKELNELTDGMKLTARDEMFEHGRGYFLVFRDGAGNVTKHLLVLENGFVSRDGLMYGADDTEALLKWLDELEIKEQNVE